MGGFSNEYRAPSEAVSTGASGREVRRSMSAGAIGRRLDALNWYFVGDPRPGFQSTLWTVILKAREGTDTDRREALGLLFQTYRGPLIAWLLGKGLSREDAQDAVQGFFAHFLEKALMDRADPQRGRFRSYLLKTMEHWLSNERRLAQAEKRGGGKRLLPLDVDPGARGSPEDAYNRAWAMTVLRKAQDLLRAEFEARGMGSHYQAVCEHLSAAGDRPSYEA